MNNNEHTKIIAKVAKQKLKPLGIVQKGKSRIWFDDRAWFTIQIEFQPSSWSRGTYLNIGANFHWYKQGHLSFDFENRQANFIEYKNDEQFTAEVERLCDLTIQKVLEIRERFATVFSAKEFILGYTFVSDELWGNYHKGTICGLTDDFEKLNKYYSNLLKENSIREWTDGNTGVAHSMRVEWIDELKERVKHLLTKTSSFHLFKTEVLSIISESRRLKKLPEVEIDS
jgi:hypothetical protein